jgi:hypothetical protein
MVPLYFIISNQTPLMIIPDSQAHFDGHPVLTYTYNIYKNTGPKNLSVNRMETKMHLEKNNDPNFLGVLTFEIPGKMFTYSANDNESLSSGDIEEIVENITHYRENSHLWQY